MSPRIALTAALALSVLAAASTGARAESEVSSETEARIMDMLAGMQCEMDPADIEADGHGGYELDDVFCADGQYDIELDADLGITGRRKE